MFRKRLYCEKCGREYYFWRECCSTCLGQNVIKVKAKYKEIARKFGEVEVKKSRDNLYETV
jgi:predicted amidophosphoribosyltransferase